MRRLSRSRDSGGGNTGALQGLRACLYIGASPALAAIGTGRTDPGTGDDGAGLARHICRVATMMRHPVGTCRMGAAGMTAGDDRRRSVENLRVADAPILPQITSGTTEAPCIMIGEKLAGC